MIEARPITSTTDTNPPRAGSSVASTTVAISISVNLSGFGQAKRRGVSVIEIPLPSASIWSRGERIVRQQFRAPASAC